MSDNTAMATQDDVRRIASKLPGAVEGGPQFGFGVEHKGKVRGFVWSWNERVHPKKPRVINDEVLVIVVGNLSAKEILLNSEGSIFFTEDHYNGFPAVHVRLEEIDVDLLEDLMIEAWRSKAPPTVVRDYDAAVGGLRGGTG